MERELKPKSAVNGANIQHNDDLLLQLRDLTVLYIYWQDEVKFNNLPINIAIF